MTAAVLDLPTIAQALGVFELSGLLPRSEARLRPWRAVPIRLLTFDRSEQVFRLTFDDGTLASVGVTDLEDVNGSEVVFWEIDEVRAGVEIALADGTVTSFSGDFALYLRYPEYRKQADSARSDVAGRRLAKRIAARVRALREERGWSQAELARRCDLAPPNLHRLEAAAHVPSTSTLVRVAGGLGVPLEQLLAP